MTILSICREVLEEAHGKEARQMCWATAFCREVLEEAHGKDCSFAVMCWRRITAKSTNVPCGLDVRHTAKIESVPCVHGRITAKRP